VRLILIFIFIYYFHVNAIFPCTLVKEEKVNNRLIITFINDFPDYIYKNGLISGIKPSKDLSTTYINGYLVPIYVKVLNALSNDIIVNVEKKGLKIINVDDLSCPGKEYFLEDNDITGIDNKIRHGNLNVYKEFKGFFNGLPITAVYVIPYIIDFDQRKVKYFKDLRVTIQLLGACKKSLFVDLNDRMLMGIFKNSKNLHAGRVEKKILSKNIQKNVNEVIKAVINKDGVYRIYGRDFKKLGINIMEINPLNIHLENKGSEFPIYVKGCVDGKFDLSDYIEFFAEMKKNESEAYYYDPFTNNNIYWIYWDDNPGLRYATEDASLTKEFGEAIVPRNYQYNFHFEENNTFFQLGQADTDRSSYVRDHWFFDYGIMGGSTNVYTFNLIYPDMGVTNSFNFKACFHGLTKQDRVNKITIYINDIKAGEGQWSGQKKFIISSSSNETVLFNKYLKHGENTIQIISESEDQLNPYTKALFDWLDLKYYREYKAFNDEIIFKKPENFPAGLYQFKVEGFNSSDIVIYELNKIRLTNFETRGDLYTGNYYVLFEDYVGSDTVEFYAAGLSAIKSPVNITIDTLGLAVNANQGDIIIISSNEYMDNLMKLEDFYTTLGYTPVTISIKNIYNDFNYGIVSPYAIKNFLLYAMENWAIKPKYLIIVGDSKIREEESVPTYFFQTFKYGASACDYWYSLIDTCDVVPDIIVGRIPCRNEEEFDLYVEKRIRYEKNRLNTPWINSIMLISGGTEAFNQQTDYIAENVIDMNTFVDKLICTPTMDYTDSLTYKMNNTGYNLINFFGHGGGAIWSDRSLMSIEDVYKLHNFNMLPIVTSMTCFTGDFAGGDRLSLGEKMVMYENGGAIVFIGSSSVGWVINDFLFIKEFYKRIREGYTVGEAINLAKIDYYINNVDFSYLSKSIMFSYNILGDPTVKIGFPSVDNTINVLDGTSRSDDSVRLTFNNYSGIDEIYCQLYGDKRDAIYKEILRIKNDGNGMFKFDIPMNYTGKYLLLTYFIPSEIETKSGHTILWRNEVDFENFFVLPENPEKGDSIYIGINVIGKGIDSVLCLVDTLNTVVYTNEYGLRIINGFNDESVIKAMSMSNSFSMGKWITNEALILSKLNKVVGVKFIAYKQDCKFESPIYTFKTAGSIDLSVADLILTLGKLPKIKAKVHYTGDKTVNTSVVFSEVIGNKNEVLDSCTLTIDKPGEYYCDIERILGFGIKRLSAVIDKDNKYEEINETNNKIIKNIQVNVFPLIPGIGTTIDGKNYAMITLDSIFFIGVNGKDVLDSSSFSIDIQCKLRDKIHNQPGFIPIHDSLWNVIFYDRNSIEDIHLKYDKEIKDKALCKFDARFNKWYVLDGQNNFTDRVVRDKNVFALFKIYDNKIPSIEINSEGKNIYDDSYVSPNSSLSIIIEDDNGLIGNWEFLKLFMNNVLIDTGSIEIIDYVPDENKLVLKLSPEYNFGINSLKVIAKDVAGNVNESLLRYRIEKDLKLLDYGNYPNPFQAETYFIYELTQDVESVDIKIYTVAGRLIKTINSEVDRLGINLAGYHEVRWDGKDDEGNYIANGVYFYKIIVKQDDKKLTSQGKIAKVR